MRWCPHEWVDHAQTLSLERGSRLDRLFLAVLCFTRRDLGSRFPGGLQSGRIDGSDGWRKGMGGPNGEGTDEVARGCLIPELSISTSSIHSGCRSRSFDRGQLPKTQKNT